MTDKPNFLFIITDQHRADWLGCMGHPVVRTPHIDSLAAKGTRFTDFHVAAPVCMPNRASLLTGRMPGLHGLRYNGCVLPRRANTFVDVLAKGGYDTALIGKGHHQPFTDAPPYHGPEPEGRLIAESWKPDGDDYVDEAPQSYAGPDRHALSKPYYGFDHVDMVTGHGDTCGGHYLQHLRRSHPDWQALRDPANELPHDYTCPQAYRTPVPEDFYPTAWIGDRAVDYLGTRKDDATPFFAFVSFPDPHHPFNPPGRYWDMYDPAEFDPDLPFAAHHNPTPALRFQADRFAKGLPGETPHSAFMASRRQVQEAMALTAGMISMIDDQVGRMLKALEASGQLDNTVIVFTSDHGDYMGDFGLLLKGPVPFRGITRVPMIWSDPSDRTARCCDALASTIDLSASILDRSGFAPYNGLQGRSFVPCAKGSATSHRDSVFIEHNDALARGGFATPARVRTLITKSHRLTIYQGEPWGELYDLQDDPRECRNLWDAPDLAAIKSDMAFALIDEMSSQTDASPLSTRLA